MAFEEMVVEGYGPGGVAILVEALTDNKNRTSAELRNIFTKHDGNIAGAGSVSWLFTKKGQVILSSTNNEEQLMDVILEAGGEDLKVEDGQASVTADPQQFEAVKLALQRAGYVVDSVDLTMIPSSTVRVDNPSQAKTLLSLLTALEDQEDVQHVYANFDIPDAILAEYANS